MSKRKFRGWRKRLFGGGFCGLAGGGVAFLKCLAGEGAERFRRTAVGAGRTHQRNQRQRKERTGKQDLN